MNNREMDAKNIGRIVILGGGYAGLLAAARVSKVTGYEIILIDTKKSFVQRIRLHEALTGKVPKSLDYQISLSKRGVKYITGTVKKLDADQCQLSYTTIDNTENIIQYEYLIYAAGSFVDSDIPGSQVYATSLISLQQSASDLKKLHRIDQRKGEVLLIGGGLTNIEAATEIAEHFPGINITLAAGRNFLQQFSVHGQRHLRAKFQEAKIKVVESCRVTGIESDYAMTTDGEKINFDLCFANTGFKVGTLAKESALKTNSMGQICVDPYLRSVSHPNIMVAGDAASVAGFYGHEIRMSCASAMPLGCVAGDNLRRAIEDRPLKIFDMAFVARCISLGRKQALIQFTHEDDKPREKIWRNRRATVTKEWICRMTWLMVKLELQTGFPLYRWLETERQNIEKSTREEIV